MIARMIGIKRRLKILNDTGQCNYGCDVNTEYKYEYNGKCYDKCPYGEFIDEYNNTKCKCVLEKCLLCPEEALNKSLCSKCNNKNNYYPIENDLQI